MTTFILVHGAFHGGWAWDEVANRLRQQGHDVYAPTLVGCAERAAEGGPNVSLCDHIDEVAALIDSGLRDVVLVGHSVGGMTVTGAADRCHDRVKALVYLDALVPVSGQSARDFIPQEMFNGALQAMHLQGDCRRMPMIYPVGKFVDFTGEAAEAFHARLTPQPFLTFVEPVFLRHRPIARRVFVYCSGVPFGLFDGFAAHAQSSPDWTYFDMPTPHDAMIVAPDAVCQALTTK
jgi:pimeloyl-ACP methyl ester carboxylesterase